MITPSTDLKFDTRLKGKNKLNYLRNYWLLIGKMWFPIASVTACCLLVGKGPPCQLRASTLPGAQHTSNLVFQTLEHYYSQENKR